MRSIRFLSCFAAVALAAGCTSAPTGSTGAAGAGPSNPTSDSAAVWRDFVACSREHGQASMPDPVVDPNGRAEFAQTDEFNIKDALVAVRDACGAILDRLPPQANPLARQAVTPEQLEVLRRYVQCMRDNGLPEMPDPGPNGELVDPPGSIEGGPLREARNAARNACDRILLEEYK